MEFLVGVVHQVDKHLRLGGFWSSNTETSHFRVEQDIVEVIDKNVRRVPICGAFLHHTVEFLDFGISQSQPSVLPLDLDLNLVLAFIFRVNGGLLDLSDSPMGPSVVLIEDIDLIPSFERVSPLVHVLLGLEWPDLHRLAVEGQIALFIDAVHIDVDCCNFLDDTREPTEPLRLHFILENIDFVADLEVVNKVVDLGNLLFGGGDDQVRILIDIVELVEWLFDVEDVLKDEGHLGVLLQFLEVLHEELEGLDHHLLGHGHHFNHLEFLAEDHVADGSVHEIL